MLTRDYLPSFTELTRSGHDLADLVAALDGARIEPIAIPHDCQDGYLHAYWHRPHAYVDPQVRAAVSVFSLLNPKDVAAGLTRLEEDLRSGRWARRNRALLQRSNLDLGYRLLVAEPFRSRLPLPPPKLLPRVQRRRGVE